tara:strand:+ start:5973 stop:6494 length:522 start_codon:yes stop_codon:yes gene_type:complete
MTFKNIIRFACEEYSLELKRLVSGLTDQDRRFAPHPYSHHIDFIVWHIARVEDHWINSFAKQDIQIWDDQNWASKLNLNINLDEPRSGWGWTIEQVNSMPKFEFEKLNDYLNQVRGCTDEYIENLNEFDMNSCPDKTMPNYSISQMLAHIVVEQSQHIGQISYIRGMLRGIDG